MSSKSSMQVSCGNCACLLSSKRTSHGLGQCLVSTCILQPLLYRWRNHVKGITAGDEHLWRIWHRGNFDKRVAQLRRVARLRAVILRPHFLGRALRRVVLDDLADPSDILRVEQIRSEETGFDHGDLIPNFSTFVATEGESPSAADFLAALARQCFRSNTAAAGLMVIKLPEIC